MLIVDTFRFRIKSQSNVLLPTGAIPELMYQCPEYYAPGIEAEVGSWFEIQLSSRSNITVIVHIIYNIIEGILTEIWF